MKIGLVLDDTLDTPDGVQQYVLNLGNWLSAQGHDVHYLVGETTRTDVHQIHSLSRNMQVRFNANRMSMPLPTSTHKLRAFLAGHEFDILHVQMPYSPFMAGRLLQVVPLHTAVVGTFHILPHSFTVRQANRLLAVLNKRSAKRFDKVVAVSQPAREFANAVYGLKGAQVVPNPINLAQFVGAKPKSRTTNIVFLGRLVERKGALNLLRAVAYVREQALSKQPFKVIVGGKGPLRPKLETFAVQHGLTDAVTFAGFVAEADKAQFLSEADIAVFPSTGGESFGIVLLEAMAASRGVVLAGNNPGYASVVPEADRLIKPRDEAGFARAIAAWLDDPGGRTQAAISQKQYVKQFDINTVGRQIEAVYLGALQKRNQL